MTRLERANREIFGPDLSGGAEWCTDGAWLVADGLYLVCDARGGVGDDVWSLIDRQRVDDPGDDVLTVVFLTRRWSDAVRVAGEVTL